MRIGWLGGPYEGKVVNVQDELRSNPLDWVAFDKKVTNNSSFPRAIHMGMRKVEDNLERYNLMMLSKEGETRFFYVHIDEINKEHLKEKLANNEYWDLSDPVGFNLD
ncbi:hypothetical protein [Acinetobacter pollinis]|uniref:hypothetical protein n=1 Tax=Acinetobacter pollinis TaxID=2605270 RepID=UPI0018A2EA15|nr:hypothetical protein [Acinetobacter pollinis]MBF7690687.1 hypothetical protein [Acinetobacter pollinis]MBF7698589.1 hypothetical protein [Acinetobacter pollinis]